MGTLREAEDAAFNAVESFSGAAEFKARMGKLLNDPKERNPAIWADAEVPEGLTLNMLAVQHGRTTTEMWGILFCRVWAAARAQAFADTVAMPMVDAAIKGAARVRETLSEMSADEIKAEAVASGQSAKSGEEPKVDNQSGG